MLLNEIKNIKSGKKELKEFSIVVGIAFAVLGLLFWWRNKSFYHWVLIIAALFLITGFLFPILLKPVHKVWMAFALLIGFVMTRIILLVLFYIVLTPISLISRLFGAQYLDLKYRDGKNSYWTYRIQKEFSKEIYEKQF